MKARHEARSFDYAAAHEDLAIPIVAALRSELPSLWTAYEQVRDGEADHVQGPDLDVQPTEAVRTALGDSPRGRVALFSAALHAWGHWTSAHSRGGDKRGTTWKVSNMIDQVLTAELGLARDRRGFSRCGFKVLEGTLRLYFMGHDYSSSVDCGPAVPELLALVRALPCGTSTGRLDAIEGKTVDYHFSERLTTAARNACAAWCAQHAPDFLRIMRAGEDYTKPEREHRHACRDCGHLPIFGKPETDHEHDCPRHPDVIDPRRLVRSSVLRALAEQVSATAPEAPGLAAELSELASGTRDERGEPIKQAQAG